MNLADVLVRVIPKIDPADVQRTAKEAGGTIERELNAGVEKGGSTLGQKLSENVGRAVTGRRGGGRRLCRRRLAEVRRLRHVDARGLHPHAGHVAGRDGRHDRRR
jgi:hypothetical protein